MFSEAFTKTSRYRALFLLPIGLDLLSFMIGILMVGYHGGSKATIRLALQVGIPSVSSVVSRSVMVGGIGLSMIGAAAVMIVIMLLFFVLRAFLMGGYIGLLQHAAEEESPSVSRFMEQSSHYFLRFIIIELLIAFITVVCGAALLILLRGAGMFIFFVLFLAMRIMYIYLEFTVAVDDCSVKTALLRSRYYFANRLQETSAVILWIILLGIGGGYVMNLDVPVSLFVLEILVYDFIAAALQLALMMSFLRIKRNLNSPDIVSDR